MRKAARTVEMEDLMSSEIFNDQGSLISFVLTVHLALEAILVEICQLKDDNKNLADAVHLFQISRVRQDGDLHQQCDGGGPSPVPETDEDQGVASLTRTVY